MATLFASLAFLNRQYGLLISFAFILTIVVFRRSTEPHAHRRNAIATLLPWAAGVPCAVYLGNTSHTDLIYYAVARGDWSLSFNILRVAGIGLKACLYMGFFLLPITLPQLLDLLRGRTRWTRREKMLGSAIACILLGYSVGWGDRLPNLPNVLRDFGLGPLLLPDASIDAKTWSPVTLGAAVWWPLTVAAAASAGILAVTIASALVPARGRHKTVLRVRDMQRVFLLVCAALLVLVPTNGIQLVYHDRYLLPAIPVLGLAAASAMPVTRRRWSMGVSGSLVCFVLVAFNAVAEQDYLAWNAARWKAIALAQTDSTVSKRCIAGGYEYAGFCTDSWSGVDWVRTEGKKRSMSHKAVRIEEIKRTIVMRPQPSAVVVARVPYRSWIGFATREILVVESAVKSPAAQELGSAE